MSAAARIAEYCESFQCQQGHGQGEPFRLLPWQRRFIASAFAAGISEAALSVGRANGKSALLGAILAACVDPEGPLHAPRSVNLVVAASLQQAAETFRFARWFLLQKYDLHARGTWVDMDSTNTCKLSHRPSGATIRALSANPRTAHGLGAFSLALLDEPGQWEANQADAMHAAIITATGKMPDSRIAAIGTRPSTDDHWFSAMLDTAAPGRVRQTFSVPRGTSDTDCLKRSVWLKANPSAKSWPTLDKALREAAGKAAKDPRLMAAFKALRCNMGLSDVRRAHLIDAREWAAAGDVLPEREGPAVWGVDLGGNRSACAIVAAWPSTGRAEALAAFPAEPPLEDRERRDHAPPRLYRDALQDGQLLTNGRLSPDIRPLIAEALERFGPPDAVAADRWKLDALQDALDDSSLYPQIVPRGMGWRDGSADVDALRFLVGERRWHPLRSRLWDWSMSRAVTTSDPAGNHKLEKLAGDDLAVASTLAAGLCRREGEALAEASSGWVDVA